ncbi:hypothetical protein [Sporosarcina sp. SAFN-015]|uniref:hypothetical protein n=1 Tax=Sporosarcina sp. SAFN-015 TaxID=3387274 RepID=UPI003F7D5929
MAEITDEIMALRNFVADIGFAYINLAHLPAEYVAGELAIRFMGDTAASETGYHFRLDRDYQFVYFDTSERACLAKASAIQRRMRSAHKINVGNATESGYLTLGSFSLSQPFKAEGAEVYGIIGMLQATAREARKFEAVPKMGGITIDVKPRPPGSSSDNSADQPAQEYPEKQYEIKEGNGACN